MATFDTSDLTAYGISRPSFNTYCCIQLVGWRQVTGITHADNHDSIACGQADPLTCSLNIEL